MILPSKHIRPDRSLLVLGGEVLALLDTPRTVSALWTAVRAGRTAEENPAPLTYDWFVLALTFLHAISAVTLEDGVLRREKRA